MAIAKMIPKTVGNYIEPEEVGPITQAVARYIVQAQFSDFPKEVIEYAKLCIQDPIACALGAASTEPGEVIIRSIKDMEGKPECTIVGDSARTNLLNAAYVNARLASLLDWDDTFDFLGHPGSTIVGSALSAAEAVGASGRDLITAVVLAYEVSTRIGDAIIKSGWVPGGIGTQSFKIFSALVPVCKLLGLSEMQIVNGLGLAASSCLGHGWSTGRWPRQKVRKPWTKGQDNRSLCALLGTLAAIQAKYDFQAELNALDSDIFWTMSGAEYCDYRWITAGLGKEYKILKNSFKPTPNCRFVHAPLTGVKELLEGWPLKADEIDKINVRSFSMVQGMMAKEPHKLTDVMQNLPYAIAMSIKGEKPGLNWYTKENFEDPVVLNVMKKVAFEEDVRASEILAKEGRWTATVEIITKDGTKKSKHVPYSWGEPENPMTTAEHKQKFEACATGLLGEVQTQEAMVVLKELEKLDQVSKLTQLLYPKA